MSRLLNPGTGDIADRLTILALKRLHGEGQDVSHFDREWALLHGLLRERPLNGVLWPMLELGAVNAALWTLEDEIRAWIRKADESPLTPVGHELVTACAFQIAATNDRRAALVQQINELAGEDLGKEKL